MEDYKREFYANDHSGEEMPVTGIPEHVGHSVLGNLGQVIGTDGLLPELVLDHLFEKGEAVDVEILNENFSFVVVLERLGLRFSEATVVVLCNGRDYKYAVELRSEDVEATFDYLWYPPADDAIVIDARLEWALSFAHYGALRYHAGVGKP
jgi:hypothetical protein